MPFDDDERKLVQKFTYKKVYVEIYQGTRGGTCADCRLDHEPGKVSCDKCGQAIRDEPVFFVSILGTEIMDRPTAKDAFEWAKSFIDDRIDRLQADLFESLMDPDDDDDEEPDELAGKLEAAEGNQDLSPLEKQIVKLGWVRKANAILAKLRLAA